MIQLSAFADEVGDDLEVQIAALRAAGIGRIELRGVWGKNVLALREAEVRTVKRRAAEAGLGFSALASPLGKAPLDGEFAPQLEALKKALEYAAILEAPYIRIFSFFLPKGRDPAQARPQVIDRLGRMVAEAEKTGVVLAHENEQGIYGDTAGRCLDLYSNLASPAFAGVFDFANFVRCGQRPYQDCWPRLAPYIAYFHVKDALLGSGQVVPAGQGDGDIEAILREAIAGGFDGTLTLEPHLSLAAASYGRTSPELFQAAAAALRAVLGRIGVRDG